MAFDRFLNTKPYFMSTYRQIYYHIVFGTKQREPSIEPASEKTLYNYIWGILKAQNCKLYQINGMPDHIHILSDLNPGISLSKYVRDLKVSSSMWMKKSGLFPSFNGWQEGYGSFTCSEKEKERVISYIKDQKNHHQKENFQDEYRRLLIEHQIEFEEKYLF
jgi:REP element-mobilizing transposase RayT